MTKNNMKPIYWIIGIAMALLIMSNSFLGAIVIAANNRSVENEVKLVELTDKINQRDEAYLYLIEMAHLNKEELVASLKGDTVKLEEINKRYKKLTNVYKTVFNLRGN